MKVCITGVCGRLGKRTFDLLMKNGYDVYGIDQLPVENDALFLYQAPPISLTRYYCADLRDPSTIFEALTNIKPDVIIHLAATDFPIINAHTMSDAYLSNVTMDFNVLTTAARLKVPKIVYASTILVYGWGELSNKSIEYAPIDENHPLIPVDVYGLSKINGENINSLMAKKYGIKAFSLRFGCWMAGATIPLTGRMPDGAPNKHLDSLTLATYVSFEDAVTACKLCIECDKDIGHEALLITAADNQINESTPKIVSHFCPHLKNVESIPEKQSVVDCSKARDLIGYNPSRRE